MNTNNKETIHLKSIADVPMELSVVIGSKSIKVDELLKMNKGDKIVLNKSPGDPVDLYISGKLIAKGEIVLLNEKIGVTITKITD